MKTFRRCRRCKIYPTVDEHAELYGTPHTRVHCPKCGFTIWALNGGDKDPAIVWNDCNKAKYTPRAVRLTAVGLRPPIGYNNDDCVYVKGRGLVGYDDYNADN